MKSRWLRFSLRTLLLLVTALCVGLGLQSQCGPAAIASPRAAGRHRPWQRRFAFNPQHCRPPFRPHPLVGRLLLRDSASAVVKSPRTSSLISGLRCLPGLFRPQKHLPLAHKIGLTRDMYISILYITHTAASRRAGFVPWQFDQAHQSNASAMPPRGKCAPCSGRSAHGFVTAKCHRVDKHGQNSPHFVTARNRPEREITRSALIDPDKTAEFPPTNRFS